MVGDPSRPQNGYACSSGSALAGSTALSGIAGSAIGGIVSRLFLGHAGGFVFAFLGALLGGVVCDIEAGHVSNHLMQVAQVDGQVVEVASWVADGVVTRGYIAGSIDADTEGRIY